MTLFPETSRAWARLMAAWSDYRLARRQSRAVRELERLVEARMNSFELVEYRKRRAAALKGLKRA